MTQASPYQAIFVYRLRDNTARRAGLDRRLRRAVTDTCSCGRAACSSSCFCSPTRCWRSSAPRSIPMPSRSPCASAAPSPAWRLLSTGTGTWRTLLWLRAGGARQARRPADDCRRRRRVRGDLGAVAPRPHRPGDGHRRARPRHQFRALLRLVVHPSATPAAHPALASSSTSTTPRAPIGDVLGHLLGAARLARLHAARRLLRRALRALLWALRRGLPATPAFPAGAVLFRLCFLAFAATMYIIRTLYLPEAGYFIQGRYFLPASNGLAPLLFHRSAPSRLALVSSVLLLNAPLAAATVHRYYARRLAARLARAALRCAARVVGRCDCGRVGGRRGRAMKRERMALRRRLATTSGLAPAASRAISGTASC